MKVKDIDIVGDLTKFDLVNKEEKVIVAGREYVDSGLKSGLIQFINFKYYKSGIEVVVNPELISDKGYMMDRQPRIKLEPLKLNREYQQEPCILKSMTEWWNRKGM